MEFKKNYAYGALVILAIIVFIAIVFAIYYRDTLKRCFSQEEQFDEDLRNIYYLPNAPTDNNASLNYITNIDQVRGAPEYINPNMSTICDNPNNVITDNLANNLDNNLSDYMLLDEVAMSEPVIPVAPVTQQAPAGPYDNRTQPILQTQSDYYLLDDGANGTVTMDYNTCSKSCCGTNDWPVPFYVPNTAPANSVPTNMFCSNSVSNGCMCATPNQIHALQTRGGNSP